MENRVGVIKIEKKIIFNSSEEELKAFFSMFYPYRIEPESEVFFVLYDYLKYYCYSPLFDLIEPGKKPPKYSIKMNRREDGTLEVTAKRQ